MGLLETTRRLLFDNAMAFLELIKGVEPGRRYELSGDSTVIGRSGECEVPLDVAAVSRRHAAIVHDGMSHFVEDLGSRNGTLVNREKITGRTRLRDGDEVLVCDQTFRFRSDQASNPLGGAAPGESSLAELVDEDPSTARASVMATLDLGPGSSSWRMSAKPEVKLGALVEISQSLGKTLSVDSILPKLLDSLFKIFVQADRGFIVMRPQAGGPLMPVAIKSRRAGDEERMRISRTIVEEALTSKKAILSADATSDQRFGMAESVADFQIRSMICAPMLDGDGNPLGVIQIDTLNQRSRFTDEDLEVLAGVASQAAISIDNARMHEDAVAQRSLQRDLELAHRMQRALLPSSPPEVPGYDFFDYYESARQVGGDYFDYVPLPGGRFAVVVGDVAGKGVSAAILMACLSSDVRFALATTDDPAVAMQQLNASFSRHDWEDRFVTMILAVVDPASNEMRLANAGHMGPLLRTGDGKVETIAEEIAGLPIGVTDDYEYESFRRQLNPGDLVTIFTDGFSEAMNSERALYGLEKMAQVLASPAATAGELGQHLLDDVQKFVDGFAQSDDMCLACFGRNA